MADTQVRCSGEDSPHEWLQPVRGVNICTVTGSEIKTSAFISQDNTLTGDVKGLCHHQHKNTIQFLRVSGEELCQTKIGLTQWLRVREGIG